MDYSIRDVSEILNLSREMIRYYEKYGVILPRRNDENDYRSYSTFDIFMLLDTLQYRSWGIQIKGMQDLRQEDFLQKSRQHLCLYRERLKEEVLYKQLLLERIDTITDRSQTAYLNFGNHWVKTLPAYCFVPLVQGDADHYGAIEIPQEASRILFTDRVAPFWNFCFEEVGNHQLWGICLPQRYFQALHLPDIEGMRLRPQQTCLCSILDLGPMGKFDPNYAQSALAYLHQKGYEQGGTMTAILLGRGFDQRQFVRPIELYIPLRLKP